MAIEKATILNLGTGEAIPVLFNPDEYSLEGGNAFAEAAVPGLRTPPLQYVRGQGRTLRMELFFDTYEQRVDVRSRTRRITRLLEQDPVLRAPPMVLFTWGGFHFKGVLDRVNQRFTLFFPSGAPARAHLTVSLKEFEEVRVEVEQGVFVGPPVVRNVVAGETIDRIAYDSLGDPAAWRAIADLNKVDNPRKLAPNQPLLIPPRSDRSLR